MVDTLKTKNCCLHNNGSVVTDNNGSKLYLKNNMVYSPVVSQLEQMHNMRNWKVVMGKTVMCDGCDPTPSLFQTLAIAETELDAINCAITPTVKPKQTKKEYLKFVEPNKRVSFAHFQLRRTAA